MKLKQIDSKNSVEDKTYSTGSPKFSDFMYAYLGSTPYLTNQSSWPGLKP